MKKIYQLIASVHLGGSEIIAFDLAEHCRRRASVDIGITVVELYSTRNDYAHAKKEDLTSKGIRVITLSRGSKRVSLLFAPFALFYWLLKEKPLIIHSHTDLPDYVLGVVIRLYRFFRIKMPRIVRTIHSTQLWRNHYRMGRFTESAFRDESIIAVSSNAMVAYEQLRKRYDLAVSRNRQIIYNGRPVPQQCTHPFAIDKNKINIAFCGRFEDYKGMETLIPAVREMERRLPGRFTFHVIGDGTYKKQLEQLAREQPHLYLYAPLPNISTLFHAFDYLFMPSHFEGLVLTSIESSFAGVPVIASHAPGLDDTLPENWPLKFHLGNDEELYTVFEEINNNKFDRESLKKNALSFVTERFSQEKMIRSYSLVYNSLL